MGEAPSLRDPSGEDPVSIRGGVRNSPLASEPVSTEGERFAQMAGSLASQSHARRGISISNEAIRVVLADDHTMVREGLRVLLGKTPDIVVVGEAESGAAATAVARRLVPDVVVLDLDMPGGHGMSVLRGLTSMPNVRVLILTMHAEDGRLVPLLEAGARGFLSKEGAARELVDAIRVVAAGEIYVRPIVAPMLAAAIAPKCPTHSAPDRFRQLSDREQTVVRMVAEGYSGVEIARALGISTKTVDAYKRRVEDKLGLSHRTHYVRFALEAGVFDGRCDARPVDKR
jgi:DNA-binding NarL/FixJ family response regulator